MGSALSTVSVPPAQGNVVSWSQELRDASLGLNGITYTITKIDDDTFSLNGVDKKNYMPFNGAKTPGICIKNPIEVSDTTSPDNHVIITAPNHKVTTEEHALISGLTGATELNGTVQQIEVVDSNTIRLPRVLKKDVSAYTSGGNLVVTAGQTIWEDTVTEGALEGEAYLYNTENYAPAPNAKFAEYLKGRLWLFGVPGQSQKAYYSESIGGDVGTPTNDAVAYPQKFASMFRGDYSITCASEVNIQEAGLISLIDDLYFFFDEKTYVLFGGDPSVATPVIVSPDIGCAFPYTLQRANIPYFGGMCLLFLSNRGPAVIKAGGEIKLFNEFKIAELWPETGYIFNELRQGEDVKRYVQRNCTSMFWNDTWSIAYKTYSGINKIFEYYFNPDLSNNSARGASEIEMGTV